MHKPHECHLEGSREHLGASCGPPGSHLGVLWELPAASWELYGLASHDFEEQSNNTSHDSTTSPNPSAWPGGMREAA